VFAVYSNNRFEHKKAGLHILKWGSCTRKVDTPYQAVSAVYSKKWFGIKKAGLHILK
jgi:hypothetical protein